MKVTIQKTLRPDAPNKRFIHLVLEGELDKHPEPGTKLLTGKVETMLGNMKFTPEAGWVCQEWNPPDLDLALEEVRGGQTFEKIVEDHLAAGWKIVEDAAPPI